jgi:ectoine hydroxylase-related dioxygenase (phytanoyl-CoA dioxygenase family)
MDIPYTRITSGGMVKPKIAIDERTLGFTMVSTKPGEAVLFHDRIIHGGSRGACSLSRVSFELTVLYR